MKIRNPNIIKGVLIKLCKASKKQFYDEDGKEITVEKYVELYLQAAKDDPEGFKKHQEEIRQKKESELALKALAEANKELKR